MRGIEGLERERERESEREHERERERERERDFLIAKAPALNQKKKKSTDTVLKKKDQGKDFHEKYTFLFKKGTIFFVCDNK